MNALNHQDCREIIHPVAPINEEEARQMDSENLAAWEDKMRAQRRLARMVLSFWGIVVALAYIIHHNWLSLLDCLFTGR